jgi:hypothetical protein
MAAGGGNDDTNIGGGEPAPVRLCDLTSLHRARALIYALTRGKRRLNIGNGIVLGSWKPLRGDREFDLSFFACYEFLEKMKTDEYLRDSPEAWATETVGL